MYFKVAACNDAHILLMQDRNNKYANIYELVIGKIEYTCKPMREKTNNLCFRPGPTQTGLYKHRSWLEAGKFGFRKKRNCTIRVAQLLRSRSAPLFSSMQIVGFLMQRLILINHFIYPP